MNDVNATLDEISETFETLGIAYAAIGGIAVRTYGIPRPTYDLDLTVDLARNRLPELFMRFEGLGYSIPESYQKGWIDFVAEMPLVKVRCFVRENGVDVDLFLAETPFQREIIARRRRVETLEGKTVWIASPEDIILLKLIANRYRDRSDIQDIFFTQGELDRGYLMHWAGQLEIEPQLSEALKAADK